MSAPALCQNCGYSNRYRRQQPNEQPLYVKAANAWVCAGCRKHRGWKASEPDAEALARMELWMAVPPNDGIYGRIPDQVYHADRSSLSSSGARTLLKETPAAFDAQRQEPPNPKPQYDFGHAAHKMVLGEGTDLAVLDPAIHGKKKDGTVASNPAATSEWKAADAKARAMGKSCITKDQMQIAQTMAGRVFAHPIAGKLLEAGEAEMSGYWHDDDTGVRLRFRTDWLTEPMKGSGRIIAVDYKSAVSADPRHFAKQCADFGYHQQQAWYEDGLFEIGIEDVGFLFIVQQKTPPFLVSVNAIPPVDVERGRMLNRRAIELYARCNEESDWPGYEPTIHSADFPVWAARAEEQLLAI
jgi:hypothetical protein